MALAAWELESQACGSECDNWAGHLKLNLQILTMHESDPLIREVLDAGARGYLLKSDATRDLVNAVEAIRRNKTYFTSRVAQMVLDGYLDKKPRAAETDLPATRLTPRQRE